MKNAIAVSTWSLHQALGFSYANGPADVLPFRRAETWGEGYFPFLDLPAQLAARGFFRVEICHFHLESWDESYLARVREAFNAAGVVIQTLLIDDGDLTNPDFRDRDSTWIKRWIDAAALLGAENARIVAGKALPTAETVALSVSGLRECRAYGASKGVGIVTENWFDLLSTPEAVHQVLDQVGAGLGFMADTGNWHGATKYPDLQSIFTRATLCHAKASFDENQMLDVQDFSSCLSAAKAAGYAGPLTLIFDAAGDEWSGLAKERAFIEAF